MQDSYMKKVKYPNLVGEPLDYSKGCNWMVKQDNGDKNVDVFFLYPTSVAITVKEDVGEVDQFMKSAAYLSYERGASCFDGMANVFAPYYRQISFTGISKAKDGPDFIDMIYHSVVRTDAYAALDYFFEHLNKGRPFILASHSQGSATMESILSEYMRLHPEYYERMIAAYTLGMSYTEEYQKANQHVKFVQGEEDTGVVIAWNSEAPGAEKDNFVLFKTNVCLINPLNWKRDETPAGIELNKGSWDFVHHVLIPGVADATINLKRKVLVNKTPQEKGINPIPPCLFGDKSYHFDDWDFYYANIKENAQKRIKAFLNK